VRLELAIEVIEHDAGLDDAASARHIEIEDTVEIFRAVDHEGMVDGLAALRRSTPARQHRHALRPRQRDGALGLRNGPWRHHADRHHLVMRSVGGVAAPCEAIEPHVAADLGLEPAFQPGRRYHRHVALAAINLVSRPSGQCRTDLTDCRIRP